MCGSTCFGRLPAHHQKHTTALGASGLTVGEQRLERCWSWSGQTTTNNAPAAPDFIMLNGEKNYFVLALKCSMEMPTLNRHSSLLLETPTALFVENK
jgi:hypothetical protein